MSVTLGLERAENPYDNYILYPQYCDMNGDEKLDILIYSGRVVEFDENNNIFRGKTNSNEIITLTAVNLTENWEFKLNRENFVIGDVEFINYAKINRGDYSEPLLFVQYCQVEEEVTEFIRDGYKLVRNQNETGYYESYILNLSTNAIKYNISDYVTDRVVDLIYLDYNEEDYIPDFILITENCTLEYRDSFEDVIVTYLAFYANGTCAWARNSSEENSFTRTYYNNIAYEGDFYANQVNETHFACIGGDHQLQVIDLRTGEESWNITHSHGSKYKFNNIFFNNIDFNMDNNPEICVSFCNFSVNTYGIGFFDFSSLEPIGTPMMIPAPSYRVEDIEDYILLNSDLPNFLIGFGDLSLFNYYVYQITELGLVNKSINLDHYEYAYIYNLNNYFFIIEDNYYLSLNVKTEMSAMMGETLLIDLESAEVEQSYSKYLQQYLIGDFNLNYQGLEILILSQGETSFRYITLNSERKYYKVSLLNESIFYITVVLMISSVLSLISHRKKLIKISGVETQLSLENESREDSQKQPHQIPSSTVKSIEGIRRSAVIMLIILLTSLILFIVFAFLQNQTETLINSGSFTVIRIAYFAVGLMCSSLTIVSILYNRFAPNSAMIYVRIQSFFYTKILKKSRNYKIVILDMNHYAKKFSPIGILQRSLFPMFISLTIGLSVFHSFSNISIISEQGINTAWISDFMLYACNTFILIYILLAVLIPGAWLLDDAGVVYFEEPIDVHAPGDISKVSDWLLNWLKGLFGITAIINYINLFIKLDINNLVIDPDLLMKILIVTIIFLDVILAPILYGLVTMYFSNTAIMEDLDYNRNKLFEKLQKIGTDLTPYKLSLFFEQNK